MLRMMLSVHMLSYSASHLWCVDCQYDKTSAQELPEGKHCSKAFVQVAVWHALSLSFVQPIPAVLEVPSKDNPYDPNQDSILSRVQHMLGAQ